MMRVDASLTLDRYQRAEQCVAECHKRAPGPVVGDIGAGDGRMRGPVERLGLTIPNPRWSRSRFVALAQGWPACFTASDLELNHHVFTPWQHVVERLLCDTGFRVTRYVTLDGSTGWPGRPYNLRYRVRLAFAGLNALVERRDPTARGMSYGVLAEKEAAQ